jgi:tetraacyldisaccharide 4'-kinase
MAPAIPDLRVGRAWIPRTWESRGGAASLVSSLLAPAAAVYRVVTSIRNSAWDRGWFRVRKAPIPIVSVGNIAVGGTGKTPFAAWVAAELARRGERPAILHGGYADDEPALHRRWSPETPVIVGRDRVRGTERARDGEATVAILDDGFQHRRLARDLDIVLVAAESWDGPHRLLPRGPWREPDASLSRADVIVVTRKSADAARAGRIAAVIGAHTGGRPCCVAAFDPAGWRPVSRAEGTRPAGPCVAVAGIAAPDSFLANARTAGADVRQALLFADHHDYTADDGAQILTVAAGRSIVTTEKDATKLERLLPDADVWALRQVVRIETGAAVLAELLDRIRT